MTAAEFSAIATASDSTTQGIISATSAISAGVLAETALGLVSRVQPPTGTGLAHWLGRRVPTATMYVLVPGILAVALMVMRWDSRISRLHNAQWRSPRERHWPNWPYRCRITRGQAPRRWSWRRG